MNYSHYGKSYFKAPLENRTWPDKEITKAPIWCSVDLRDGNQALITPMTLEEKLEFFKFLTFVGFKEIEVGFPAASNTEFEFVRELIERDLIPDDVTIQVLTQIRPHIMEKTFKSIEGSKNAIVHIYNSTSLLQREAVFKITKEETINLAVEGARFCKERAKRSSCENIRFEYSPESFTSTEPEFALEICNAVINEFLPDKDNKVIINLPSTIELSSPNAYADMIEFMSDNLISRENVILSLHTHNDRGCAVAATELGLMAGADRVEGTLFGNGERTGNADILVLALNMFSQGVDPILELSDMNSLMKMYEDSTKMLVEPRHPYAGELVYTAFSGSHQDAIKKGMDYYGKMHPEKWVNPYLPINPADIGRDYEPIRINSQSGKGGINYILESKYGISAPKAMLTEFSLLIKDLSDRRMAELSPQRIYKCFVESYVSLQERLGIIKYNVHVSDGVTKLDTLFTGLIEGEYNSTGNGPLDALNNAVKKQLGRDIEITAYHEHAMENRSSSAAMAYIGIKVDDKPYWGAGISTNINTASMEAYISAINRAYK
ncbi:MAG: 2-isopropylmalate synthase [Bacillota bacterium]|nr:2-isopropylmalate synthase [Bacillota bacterium]